MGGRRTLIMAGKVGGVGAVNASVEGDGGGVRRAGWVSFFGADCDGCACLVFLGFAERRENVSWSGCCVDQLEGSVIHRLGQHLVDVL